jgi:hypothetical protein
MTGRRIVPIALGALLLFLLADALARPDREDTAREGLRTQLDREWIRVYEDGQHGTVFRFLPDGTLKRIVGGETSWRTWEAKDGGLLLDRATVCRIVPTVAIVGNDEGNFVMVPKRPGEQPAVRPKQGRLRVRIFVDGKDTIYVRGTKLWVVHHAFEIPGTDGGKGPTYVNGIAWQPAWSEMRTEPFENVDPPLPVQGDRPVWIAKLQGRGSITVYETPSPRNDHVLALTIDDPLWGAEWYEIAIDWSAGPR